MAHYGHYIIKVHLIHTESSIINLLKSFDLLALV
jgi:hypothetical protein